MHDAADPCHDPDVVPRRDRRDVPVEAAVERTGRHRCTPTALIERHAQAAYAALVQRLDPADAADERTQLTQFLDFQRATVVGKVEGLDRDQMHTTTAASSLTLAGLLKHLAVVEDGWTRRVLLGDEPAPWYRHVDDDADPEWDFRTAVDDDPADLISLYERTCERSREAVASVASLDDLTVGVSSRTGAHLNLRWVLLHLIEETARHAGHADLLREAIDGTTGE